MLFVKDVKGSLINSLKREGRKDISPEFVERLMTAMWNKMPQDLKQEYEKIAHK